MPLADRPLPGAKGDRMRTRLGVISVGIIVALALLASGAQATGGGRVASACSNETVNGGRYVGKLTLRFGLIGSVSCNEAHSVVRAYFRKMAAGQCGAQNNFCNLQFAGGWDCSIFFATESQEAGGAIYGCARPGAKIRLYKVSSPASTGMLHLAQFLSPDHKVWCLLSGPGQEYNPSSCGTHPEPPTWAAFMDSHGKVELCFVSGKEQVEPGAPPSCYQNWGNPPILHYGQVDELGGVRCTSAVNGITCVKVTGLGRGSGFRVSKDEAVRFG